MAAFIDSGQAPEALLIAAILYLLGARAERSPQRKRLFFPPRGTAIMDCAEETAILLNGSEVVFGAKDGRQRSFEMMQENEIWEEILEPIGQLKEAFNASFSKEESNEISSALAEFLVEAGKDNAGVQVEAEDLPTKSTFKSILFKSSKRSNKILCFTFKDAAFDTAFPMLGMALTLYAGKWGPAIPQAAGLLKTLWSKLVLLKRPADSNAIDVLNALIRKRAKHVLDGNKGHPTTHEIEIECGMSRDPVVAALKSLRSRGVIDVESWAGQTDDLAQPENRWKVRL